jgi:hypothetical protein
MNQGSFLRDTHELTIKTDENATTMMIAMRCSYLRDGLTFVLSILFVIPFLMAPWESNDSSAYCVIWFIISALLTLTFSSIHGKRSVNGRIKRDLGTVWYRSYFPLEAFG